MEQLFFDYTIILYESAYFFPIRLSCVLHSTHITLVTYAYSFTRRSKSDISRNNMLDPCFNALKKGRRKMQGPQIRRQGAR